MNKYIILLLVVLGVITGAIIDRAIYIRSINSKINNTIEEAKYEAIKRLINVAPDCNLRDYQIQPYMDTVWIYDEDRLVSVFVKDSADWNNKYDSIFIEDNL